MILEDSFKGYQLRGVTGSEIDAGTLDSILDLYAEVYGEKAAHNPFIRGLVERRTEGWEWKFRHPSQPESVFLLAHDGTRLIGYWSLVGRTMKLGERTALVGQGVDAMISPDYQGQGIYTVMSTMLMDAVADTYPVQFSFPNLNNTNIKLRTGFTPVGHIPLLEKNGLTPSPTEAKLTSLPVIGAGGLWGKVSKEFDVGVVRDDSYLSYRYLANPTNSYNAVTLRDASGLQGYAILKEYGTTGHIVDLLATGELALSHLVAAAESHFASQGKERITMFMLPGTWYRPALEARGFSPEETDTYFMFKPDAAFGPAEGKSFFIGMGDNDIF